MRHCFPPCKMNSDLYRNRLAHGTKRSRASKVASRPFWPIMSTCTMPKPFHMSDLSRQDRQISSPQTILKRIILLYLVPPRFPNPKSEQDSRSRTRSSSPRSAATKAAPAGAASSAAASPATRRRSGPTARRPPGAWARSRTCKTAAPCIGTRARSSTATRRRGP